MHTDRTRFIGPPGACGYLVLVVALLVAIAGLARAQTPHAPSTADFYKSLNVGGPTQDPTMLAAAAMRQALAAVAAAGGDASATVVLPAAPLASNRRSLAARAAERVSVADYAPPGTPVGGGTALSLLRAQAAGDTTMLVQSITGLAPGQLVTSQNLPPGTRIQSVGTLAAATINQATSAATLVDAEEQALYPTPGLSSELNFAAIFAVPPASSVTGAGIPPGTLVASVSYPATGGTVIALNTNVSADIAAGATIGFSYQRVPVTLANGWNGAVAPGTAVGIAAQDDWQSFQNAAFFLAPEHGGPGGTIWVPSGTYYLSQNVTTYDGIGFEFGSAVTLLPGSSSVDTVPAGLPFYSADTITGGARNPAATTLTVAQNLFQPQTRTVQEQALLVSQNNVNCTNDGGGFGCGMVGAEVKQGISVNIRRGILWAYHSTDDALPGQNIAYAGAELELRNNSGLDWMWGSTPGNKTGLHIDDLGNTPNTVALLPAGNIAAGGGWHRAVDCPQNAIMDDCIDIQSGPLSGSGLEPIVVAGLDMAGRYFGTALSIYAQPSQVTGALTNPGAAIDASGNIGARSLNTQIVNSQTGSIASVTVIDGGAAETGFTLEVQPPVSGTAASLAVSGYSLRFIEGFQPVNNPAGMRDGDVYVIPGGSCTIPASIGYAAGAWSIANPGNCTLLPVATASTPVTATGGSATIAPQFALLWQMTGISVLSAGSGYNPAIPPAIRARTAGPSTRAVRLVPLMTSASAPLLLNNSGLTENGAIFAASIQASGSVLSTPSSSSYTVTGADCGTTIEPAASSPITMTVPAGLPLGCKIDVNEVNAVQVSFAAGPGMAMHSIGGASKISANFGGARLIIDSAGSFLLSGNIQ